MEIAKVVVWDPNGKYRDGDVVSGEVLKSLGSAVALPVDPVELLGLNAVSAFMKASYGKPGWKFFGEVGTYGCPLLLWMVPHKTFVHWAARIVPAGQSPSGKIKMVHNGYQPGAGHAGIASNGVVLSDLGPPDEFGGWTVGSAFQISVLSDGYLGISLYCAAQNLAVEWVAAAPYGTRILAPYETVSQG